MQLEKSSIPSYLFDSETLVLAIRMRLIIENVLYCPLLAEKDMSTLSDHALTIIVYLKLARNRMITLQRKQPNGILNPIPLNSEDSLIVL